MNSSDAPSLRESPAQSLDEAIELVEILAEQCEDAGIRAADLIEWNERDEIGKALRRLLEAWRSAHDEVRHALRRGDELFLANFHLRGALQPFAFCADEFDAIADPTCFVGAKPIFPNESDLRVEHFRDARALVGGRKDGSSPKNTEPQQ